MQLLQEFNASILTSLMDAYYLVILWMLKLDPHVRRQGLLVTKITFMPKTAVISIGEASMENANHQKYRWTDVQLPG